jgi:two-component system, LytTR family, response regulator
MTISCYIIDDEPMAIDILSELINDTHFLRLEGHSTQPMQAMDEICLLAPDLIFLDIQMGSINGMELIETIYKACGSKVILTTGFADYAIKSYELDVVDYLLKPVQLHRFKKAVYKALKLLEYADGRRKDDLPGELGYEHIYVNSKERGRNYKIFLSNIIFVEACGNYVSIHQKGSKIMVYSSLKSFVHKLPAKYFLRIHNSYIIALSKIMNATPGQVTLESNEILPVSESYRDKFCLMAGLKSEI